MKSLAAWSLDRESALRVSSESHQSAAGDESDLSSAIQSTCEALQATMVFYEAAALQGQQSAELKRWVAEQSGLLKSTVTDQVERVRANLLKAMTEAVSPLLASVIEKKAVDDFCGTIEKLSRKSSDESAIIIVPERLHNALREELQKRGLNLETQASATEEIVLRSGDTLIETRIQSVQSELEQVLNP